MSFRRLHHVSVQAHISFYSSSFFLFLPFSFSFSLLLLRPSYFAPLLPSRVHLVLEKLAGHTAATTMSSVSWYTVPLVIFFCDMRATSKTADTRASSVSLRTATPMSCNSTPHHASSSVISLEGMKKI